MAYPSTVTILTDPQPTDKLNSPSHSSLHQSENTEIEAIQTFVGTTNTSVIGTLIYDIRSPNSNGGGHVQTATKGGTGQSAFTKGDILVAQSSSTISKLAVGSDNTVLISDSSQDAGVKWGAVPGQNVQSFISTGVWIKPSTAGLLSRVFVELWGSGGGGGGGGGSQEAGGGGGGHYIAAWFSASILSSSVLVGVGPGGVGVLASDNGGAGQMTVFDPVSSLLTAFGGGGGGSNGTGAGGGGGGGTMAAGSPGQATGVGSSGGAGAQLFGGTGGNTNTAGSVAGFVGSAGGGGGGGGDGAVGGLAQWGGGGGGGARSGVIGAGGLSKGGGNGGSGSILTNASMVSGKTPGGGGGASFGSGATSGAGGSGKAIITTFV